jgi:hypothetical protein
MTMMAAAPAMARSIAAAVDPAERAASSPAWRVPDPNLGENLLYSSLSRLGLDL